MFIEENIFNDCLRYERRAQEALYKSVFVDVMRISLRYVHNEDDAKGIVNSSMLKVFTKIRDYKGSSENFGGWIRRIVINDSLDYIRKQNTYTDKIELTEIEDTIGLSEEISFDSEPNKILLLLKELPLLSSSVFNLFVVEGYSHKEISEMLKISVANSKWNLHSARKQLKLLINKHQLI